MSLLTKVLAKGLSPDWADYDNWPKVRSESVKKKHRPRFVELQTAVELYASGPVSLRAVEKATSVPRATVDYFVDKALELHEDGRIYGERALVRFEQRKAYEATGDASGGLAGQFKRLLHEHPSLEDVVLACVVEGKSPADTHQDFKDKLYELGYTNDDYPLDTDSQGEWSVNELRKRLRAEYFREAALAEGGEDAARNADVSHPMRLPFRVERPYQRIELDAHVLKAIFTIDIEELDGTVRTVTLKRLYVVAAIDAYSKAVLGYHISMNAQPSIEDVVSCLAHVLDPMSEDHADIMGYLTGRGVGLPDRLIEGLRFRAFNELAMDNALAHTSPALHRNLIGVLCTTINLGKSKHPQGRSLIEGWFKLLRKFLADPLPSSTGSKPDDPKRRHPEKKAKRYKISLADLEVLIEAVIRGYNQEYPETTTGRSPLAKLEHWLTKSTGLVRRLRPIDRGLDFLYKRYYRATIAGSVSRGLRPYIQFQKAIYRNQQLSAMAPLIGKPVTLEVDIRDLRCIHAYLESGESIGILQAQGGWATTPHSLQTRQAINRHRNRVRVRHGIGDFVRWFVEELAKRKKRHASMPNITTRINHEIARARNREQQTHDQKLQQTPKEDFSNWLDIGPDIEVDDED